jgi:hypothetical protein
LQHDGQQQRQMQQQGQQRQALDRASIEALESQIESELRRSGASGQQGGGGVPLSSGTGAKRSLGEDIDASGQLAAAAAGYGWALQQGAAEGGAGGMVFGSLGDAIGSLEYSSAGEEGPAGGSYGKGSKGSGADLTTAGLAHFAAKLHNGGITPGCNQLAPAGGSGRYATSLDENLDSQQWAAAAAAGRQGGAARAAGASRTRPPGVPALSISRISIADLLEGSTADASLLQHQQLLGGQQLQPVSRKEQASISKLAASMHSGGMAAGVTPADIRAALAGAAVRLCCWGQAKAGWDWHADILICACLFASQPALMLKLHPLGMTAVCAGSYAGMHGAGDAAEGYSPAGLAQNLAAAGLFATPEVSSSRPLSAEGDYPNLASPAWPASAAGGGGGTAVPATAATFGTGLAAEAATPTAAALANLGSLFIHDKTGRIMQR